MLTISELPRIFGWTCIKEQILSSASIEIDIEGNKKYLESKNEDTVNMTEDQIEKSAYWGKCFLKFTDGNS